MVSTGIRPAAGDGNSNPLMRKRPPAPPRLTAARLAVLFLAGLLLLLVSAGLLAD